MRYLKKFTPMICTLFIPFWHISKLNQSPLLLVNLIRYKGPLACIGEMISFSTQSIICATLFYIFVKRFSLKVSLLISSLIFLSVFYLFLTPTLFYDYMPLFLIAASLSFDPKEHQKHLFFSLFFITLGFTFSCLLTTIHFYGSNLPLFLLMISPLLSLYMLSLKDIYPSKTILLSLLPINIFPMAYLVHNPKSFSLYFVLALLIIINAVYTILSSKSYKITTASTLLSFMALLILPKELHIPFLFIVSALVVKLMQILYESRHPQLSHTHVLQQPMQPFSLSLRFYNEYMHY
jgi:hypothetical protein